MILDPRHTSVIERLSRLTAPRNSPKMGRGYTAGGSLIVLLRRYYGAISEAFWAAFAQYRRIRHERQAQKWMAGESIPKAIEERWGSPVNITAPHNRR